jgi:hypothetical protein
MAPPPFLEFVMSSVLWRDYIATLGLACKRGAIVNETGWNVMKQDGN